ncbi:MAG TPA: pyridoxamine 5'-phosphate oxidase family protein [Candidatus Binataceae bacterium]|nr:pyridoxamine 5'-phosphate oxidase family protein [Candidatus Binataceae bacterium]
MTSKTSTPPPNHPPSERTTVKRMPHRGVYDRAVINAILDEGLICHLGFTIDSQPYVLPTIYARGDEQILIHGSAASRMLRNVRSGIPVCATVTLIDGLVLARSAYHHSMNYRSVVILGTASEICDRPAKVAAMRQIVEHVVPGRWDEVRAPSEAEIRATMVLSLPLNEASAKVRTGPPIDDEEDYALGSWAGVLPLSLEAHAPLADPRMPAGIQTPTYIRSYRRGGPARTQN